MSGPVAYGVHAVRVLLERTPQRVRRVLLATGKDAGRLAEIRTLAARAAIPVVSVDEASLDKLADAPTRCEVLPADEQAVKDFIAGHVA